MIKYSNITDGTSRYFTLTCNDTTSQWSKSAYHTFSSSDSLTVSAWQYFSLRFHHKNTTAYDFSGVGEIRYWDSSGILAFKDLSEDPDLEIHSEIHTIGTYKVNGADPSHYISGLFYKISFRDDYYDSSSVGTRATFISDKINSYSLNFNFFDPDRNVYLDGKVQK